MLWERCRFFIIMPLGTTVEVVGGSCCVLCFVFQPHQCGEEVNLTLVEQLVSKYRFDLEQPLPPGHDPWAVAEKWVTDRQLLPEDAPELGVLRR